MNPIHDTAANNLSGTQSDRLRALRASRREYLSRNRHSLLRSKTYRLCGWLLLLGAAIAAAGCFGNFFLVGTSFDVITFVGLIVGPAAIIGSIVTMAATKVIIVPIYEYIKLGRAFQSTLNCAMCAIGEPHN